MCLQNVYSCWCCPQGLRKIIWHIRKSRFGRNLSDDWLQKTLPVQEIQLCVSVLDKFQIRLLHFLISDSFKEDQYWDRTPYISPLILGGWIWGNSRFRVENCCLSRFKLNSNFFCTERIFINSYKSLHYWLRPIKRGQFEFANFAPHFEGKCHFHFLIHWVLLKSL